MNILYDCTTLSKWKGHATGIQRVVTELGIELIKNIPNAIPVIFESDGVCKYYNILSKQIGGGIQIRPYDIIFSAGHDWDYLDHFDILQDYISKGARFGVLIYDLIPIKFPFTYSEEFVSCYKVWLNKALQTASFTLTISNSTAKDIEEYAEVHGYIKPIVAVIRLGDRLRNTSKKVNSSPINKFKKSIPFIVCVGTLEYRKNHIVLLNAYRYLIDEKKYFPPKLYLIGKQGYLDFDLKIQVQRDTRLNNLIEIIHDVTDAELEEFYSKSLFTVYPSIYEGWGLPVAESLHYGKPCIAANASSTREIAPDLVRLLHPFSVREWAEEIHKLSEDHASRSADSYKIEKTYQGTSWADTAKKIGDYLNVFN